MVIRVISVDPNWQYAGVGHPAIGSVGVLSERHEAPAGKLAVEFHGGADGRLYTTEPGSFYTVSAEDPVTLYLLASTVELHESSEGVPEREAVPVGTGSSCDFCCEIRARLIYSKLTNGRICEACVREAIEMFSGREWINVEECLPEPAEQVLVWMEDCRDSSPYDVAFIRTETRTVPVWETASGCILEDVTYWRPLLEAPPKKEA